MVTWGRMHRAFAGALALVLVAAACQPAAPAGGGPAATATAKALATKIVVATAETAPNLDRQIVSSNGSWDTLFNVTDPVVRLSPKGEPLPGLAESWKVVDDKTLRLNLRKDVTFSDGEKFDAAAFKVSMDRIMTKESRVGETGIPSMAKGQTKVVDEFTVDLIHAPDVALLNAIAINVEIFSPKVIKENVASLKTNPIGTGPYKVASYESGRLLKFVARDDYWGAKVFGTPTLKEVEIRLGLEPGVRLSLLQSGEAQLVQGISPDDAALLAKDQVLALPGPEIYWLRFGFLDPLSNDIRIRQAISLAIDRSVLVKLFGGFGEAATQMWPSYTTGWADRPAKFDLEKAKGLVQQAGAAGKTVQLNYSADYKLRMGPVAEALAAMIEKTGLKVSLGNSDGQSFRTSMRDVKKAGALTLIAMSFESFDATRGMSSRVGCGGGVSTYCNKDADKLLDKARGTEDATERTKLLQSFMDALDKDVAVVPLINPPLLWAKSPKLQLKAPPFQALPFVEWKLEK